MPYLLDRKRALFTEEIVALMSGARARGRCRVTMNDNSLYHTLTRPQALLRQARAYPEAVVRAGARRRSPQERRAGATWRKPTG